MQSNILNYFICLHIVSYFSQLFSRCNEIAIRCIELFVRHTCLLRPISQGGRMRLGSDYTHLEQALKTLYPVLSDLGRPFRLFKSMVTLITLSPSEIVASQVTGSCVPPSTVLLLLFSFAGPELASPHQNTGWTISKLSAWLDEHQSESDRSEYKLKFCFLLINYGLRF